MVEHEDVASREDVASNEDLAAIELHVRELTAHALEAARERATCEAAIQKARETLEAAQRQLPEAERDAKERRQSQNDAIRGRAELEHRLAELVEAEDLTRARRLQAEQRAQGFRAAAAFAAAGRTEAEKVQDNERLERERLVEERANREASAAEARASEEQAEETKLGRHRAEIETHVEAERSLEAEIASDRTSSEALVATLKETIENATFELHEAEVNLERLDADRERLAQERAIAGERLREVGRLARGEIEARIAELRAKEREFALQREEQERLLASLIALEEPVTPEPEPEPEPDDSFASQPLAGERSGTHALTDEDPAAHAGGMSPQTPAPASPAPVPHVSTVTYKASPAARESAATPRSPEPPSGPESDRDNMAIRSLIGNIFTRRKPVEELVEDEGPSISERIARDFGLLGATDDDDEQAPDSAPHAQFGRTADAHDDVAHAALSHAARPEASHTDESG